MKRILAVLLVCLLLPAYALAFDLSPYELEPMGEYDFTHSVLPIARGEYIRVHSHNVPGDTLFYTLDHRKDGAQHLNITLPKQKFTSYTPLFLGNGTIGVMQHSDRIEGSQIWKQDYTLYDLSGSELVNPRTFEGAPYMLKRFNGGFAGVRGDGEELSELLIYNDELTLRLRHTLPLSDARIQAAFSHGSDVYVLILQQGMGSDVFVLRIGADNTVAWTYADNSDTYHYNTLHTDGQGGLLMTGSLDSDYKKYRVTHLSADGECDWSKTLSVKNAIAHPGRTVAQEDGSIILYGYAVARSRDLFTLFAINMDAKGRILSVDARDYSARKDTSPGILFAQNGTPFVYSFVIDERPAVLVPFYDLPKTKDPGITLK